MLITTTIRTATRVEKLQVRVEYMLLCERSEREEPRACACYIPCSRTLRPNPTK